MPSIAQLSTAFQSWDNIYSTVVGAPATSCRRRMQRTLCSTVVVTNLTSLM
jgi:hypothetical protein